MVSDWQSWLAPLGTRSWHRAWVSIVSGPLPNRPSLLSHKATFFRSSRRSLRTRTTNATPTSVIISTDDAGSFDSFCSAGSSEDKKKKKQTKLTPEEHALRKAKLVSLVTASGSRASLGKRCDFGAVLLCEAKQEEEGNPAVTPKTLLNARSSACPICPEFCTDSLGRSNGHIEMPLVFTLFWGNILATV